MIDMFINRGMENSRIFMQKNTTKELIMSSLSLRINMDKPWNIILTDKTLQKIMLIWFHLCTLLNIQNNIHSRSKKNWISKVYLNIRVEIVNRKKKKELLFYLNILALLKIRLEVNTTKCSYLLNLSGGCLRVNHILFSTFILCMWKYFKIKISNLTIALAVVWLETMEIFFFLPKQK